MRIITCCGEELDCEHFNNTCKICGTDYNWAGQKLAPRCQWGEETGETEQEILAIDSMSVDRLLGDE